MFEIFSRPIPKICFDETNFIPITFFLKIGEMYLPVISELLNIILHLPTLIP